MVQKRSYSRTAQTSKTKKTSRKDQNKKKKEDDRPLETEEIRLNKYIANAGICSRRDADKLIEEGKVKVNGKVVKELGLKVKRSDTVVFEGRKLNPEKPVYVLLNKPKDFITTVEDTHNRKTVMDLVSKACDERIYPVGRLDRMTTGLLLFTNDGELAKRLMHPSHQIRKIYQVELDKPIENVHFEQILEGIELEDGKVQVDEIAILEGDNKRLGIQIHIGKNRIVRRIFEHLGYRVIKLDRVVFGGLTKKDLPRGKFRHLKPREIQNLKNMLRIS
jgi:23S rRNA pseudouridine2605 synthase